MAKTKINWADVVWNPITGCTKVSAGCDNCYAERMSKRLAGRHGYPEDEPFKVTMHLHKLNDPFNWKKPQRIFVNSMSDLFHEDVPFTFLFRLWLTMQHVDNFHHTFLILTKRPERMLEFYNWLQDRPKNGDMSVEFARPHIWLGVTAETQEMADLRIPILLQIPAAVRFVSVEPMIGPVDLRPWLKKYYHGGKPGLNIGDKLLPPSVTRKPTLLQYAQKIAPEGPQRKDRVYLTIDQDDAGIFAMVYSRSGGSVYRAVPALPLEEDPDCKVPGYSFQTPVATVVEKQAPLIDWVIAGGESGPGARPCHPDWIRNLRDQCQAVGVPFFFKQHGEWIECNSDELPPSRYDERCKTEFKLLCNKGWKWTLTADAMFDHQEHNYPDHFSEEKPICNPITVRRVGKKKAGRELDGRTHEEIPDVGVRKCNVS
ncbi:MAG: DUF5131 family protein [Bacillota bacterium]